MKRGLPLALTSLLLACALTLAPRVAAGQSMPANQGAPHMPMDHMGGMMGHDVEDDGVMMMAPQFPIEKLHHLEAPIGTTALAGQTLQVDGQPLVHVRIEIDGKETYSDGTGRFILQDLSFGHHVVNVYGATAKPKRPYGFFQLAVEIKNSKTNVLPYTVFIPVLDMEHATHFSAKRNKEVVATTPLLPGFEAHIPADEVLRGVDGKVLTEVSITPIPMMQMPMPGAPGTEPPVSFTLQADGATDEKPDGTFGPGVSIVFPNTEHLRPGARVDYWTYDPKIKGGWFIYGQGSVTSNGKQIVPDAGVVLHRLSCSPFNVAATPANQAKHCPDNSQHCMAGEPVDLASGLFVYKKTDLVIDDIIPITFTRSYRQMDSSSRDFGIGSVQSYGTWMWNQQLDLSQVDVIMPDGVKYHYTCISTNCSGAAGTVLQNSTDPGPFYMSTVTSVVENGIPIARLRLKDGTIFGYNLSGTGRLMYVRDKAGNQLTVTVDNGGVMGKPIQVTSPGGRWIKLTYDTSNRITQIQDNIGRTVSYVYDGGGRLSTVTDVAGGVTTYTYDGNNNMLTITDPRNVTYLTNQYDSNNRVIKQTQADGSTFQFTYTLDVNGNVTQTAVTNPRGDVRVVTFNTSFYWTADTRDSMGAAPQAAVMTRQPATNLSTSSTDALGRTTSVTYDSLGNPLAVTRLFGTPQAVTTSFTYEPTFSNVTSITDPLNHTTNMSYDSVGNLTMITDPLGNQSLFTYSSLGQVLTATDPLANTTQFAYDPASKDLISVTDPLSRTVVRSTDDLGRVVGITDPLGHVTRYDYSAMNQVNAVTDPLGNQTLFNYDGDGNMLTLTDANGHSTQYTYDGMDRVITRKDPLLNQDAYQYDAAGNLIRFTDRRGKITVYAYDSLNRLSFTGYGAQQTAPTYESSTTYTYDAVSRLTQVVDSVTGTIARDYDALDHLVSETTPQGTVAYSYDAAGRRASLSVPGQPDVNYTFDEANRLTQINQNSSTVSFTFDSAGRRTSMILPNGVTASYSYDDASQLTGLSYATSAGPLGNLTYAYDMAGRRVSVGGTLAQTNLPSPVSVTAYNSNNQLTTWGTANLFYDANGNMTSDGTNSFVWNARNKLASMNFTANSFQYDPFGRRQAKTISGTTTNYLYDGVNVAQEVSGTTPTANLLSGGVDEVFTRTDSSGTANFVTDALGSTVALTNGSGSTVASYAYDPFGNTTQTGTSTNSYQYAGRENDGAGLYFNRGRYYSPNVQRFVSQDPIGFGGGINLYSYVSNNPAQFSDPYGHDKEPPTSTGNGKTPKQQCIDTFLRSGYGRMGNFMADTGVPDFSLVSIGTNFGGWAKGEALTLGGKGVGWGAPKAYGWLLKTTGQNMQQYPGLLEAGADSIEAGSYWASFAAVGEFVGAVGIEAAVFATTADLYSRWTCRNLK